MKTVSVSNVCSSTKKGIAQIKTYGFIALSLLLTVITSCQLGAQCLLSVVDQTGVPLVGVNLLIESSPTDMVIVSDAQGQLLVEEGLVSADTLIGQLSFIGFERQEILLYNGLRREVVMKPSAIFLQEAVVTGEYAKRTVDESVHRVDVITAEEISRSGASDLKEVLRHSGEVIISQDGVLGTSISIQGLSDRHVRITVDEVPLVGRVDGKLDLGQIDIQNIERIEIVKGPMSASYGSDAIAGVINIVTKTAQQEGTTLGVRAYASSEGQYDLNARYAGGSGNYRYALRAGRRYFDGWSASDPRFGDVEPIADARRSRQWNPKEQYLAGLDHGWYTPGRSLSHRFSVATDDLIDRGLPVVNNAAQTIIAIDTEYATRRIDNQIKYTQDSLAGGRYSGFVAHNYFDRHRRQSVTDVTDLEQRMLGQDTTVYHALSSRHTWSRSPSDELAYQVGIDGSYDTSTGERIAGEPSISQLGVFASMEYRPTEAWVIRPALRYGVHSLFDIPLVPSFSARYQKGEHTVRASVGQGFRAPDFKELYLAFFDSNHNVFGNEDLDAESSTSVELAYGSTRAGSKMVWKWDASLFYNEVDRLITEVQVGVPDDSGVAPFTYRNIDRVETRGARVDLNVRTETTGFRGGVGITGREEVEAGVFLTPLYYFWQANAGVDHELSRIKTTINVLYTYNGRQQALLLRNNVTESLSQGAYQLLDLSVTKTIVDGLKLQVGVRNLLDVTDVAVNGRGGIHGGGSSSVNLIATGRNYFMAVQYDLRSNKKAPKTPSL